MFERLNAAAFDRLKEEWECQPNAMARCTDAAQRIWEVHDVSMGVWVSVCLVTNYCCCGNSKQYCQHIQLAEHIASCGNNPQNSQCAISRGLQKQAVYAAQQSGPVSAQQAKQQLQQYNRLLQVSTISTC